jgi:hypothetical protein
MRTLQEHPSAQVVKNRDRFPRRRAHTPEHRARGGKKALRPDAELRLRPEVGSLQRWLDLNA